jgi:hypothetical protein
MSSLTFQDLHRIPRACRASVALPRARLSWVDGHGDANLRGELYPVQVHVGNYHIASCRVFRGRSCHDSDGPGPSDRHLFPKHGKRKGGMNGVAERIEDGGNVGFDFADAVTSPATPSDWPD